MHTGSSLLLSLYHYTDFYVIMVLESLDVFLIIISINFQEFIPRDDYVTLGISILFGVSAWISIDMLS